MIQKKKYKIPGSSARKVSGNQSSALGNGRKLQNDREDMGISAEMNAREFMGNQSLDLPQSLSIWIAAALSEG